MKKTLKFLRSLLIINIPVRSLMRGNWRRAEKRFRFFSKHWPVFGTISFELPDGERVKIFSRGDDFVSTQAYWKGYEGYEGPAIRLFYHLAKRSETIIDVGANVGYFSLIAAAANKSASIYSFEPVENIFLRLKKNAVINSFSNINPIRAVAGDSNGEIKFYVPISAGMPHAASTKKGWSENSVEVTVTSWTIDHFKKEKNIGRIGLVKLDCEFHEPQVLAGMKEILRNDKPIILSEVLFPESDGVHEGFESDAYLHIENALREAGYSFYLINSTALVRVDKLEYNPDDRNYLFSVKRSSHTYLPYSDMNNLLNNII